MPLPGFLAPIEYPFFKKFTIIFHATRCTSTSMVTTMDTQMVVPVQTLDDSLTA
jgi:hypothetical protein